MDKSIYRTGGVELMKASAGSGKTYSLTKEYLRLLLENKTDGNAYRHILAVTFTNKATEEMKSRIVDELDTLAHYPDHSPYLDCLLQECAFEGTARLQEAARKALTEILSDYGAFSVSTIDKFFQRVLRCFAREAGQFGDYQIELDRNSLVAEAADRVLNNLDGSNNPALLDWLVSSALENISEGEKYDLGGSMKNFAMSYMSEEFRSKAEKAGMDTKAAFSQANLRSIRDVCAKITRRYKDDFIAASKEALACVESQINPDRNFIRRLKNFSETGVEALDEKFLSSPPGYWTKAVEEGIIPKLSSLLGRPYLEYRTALLLKKQVSVFRVADALDREFSDLLEEKGVLGIEDTNRILRDIIDGSDAPFIYEKLGVRYEHFLLDEFQDTSFVQWDNFRPLLLNSISQGFYNLIVGDVKQSIYRWRNASWEILQRKVRESFSRTSEHSLQDNWRSAVEIVRFNNTFFGELPRMLDRQLQRQGLCLEGSPSLEELYSDVHQNPRRSSTLPEGSVEISFCESKELYLQCCEAVKSAMERGFRQGDIAVIVRTNRMGGEIASLLVQKGLSVITNDSLRLSGSRVIRMLISRLYLIDNPDDRLRGYNAGEDFDPIAVSGGWQSLVDLCDSLLASIPQEKVNGDTLYVLSFMDLVKDFVERNGNSLHSFLEYWETEGMQESISSPDGADAVTVITTHSVKGLDYPYVIMPVQKREQWVQGNIWAAPNVEGTHFGRLEKAIYDIPMKKGTLRTLFSEEFRREMNLCYADNLNVWYVAMTRAVEGMHIVAPLPIKAVTEHRKGSAWADVSGLGGSLYQFVIDHSESFSHIGNQENVETYLWGVLSEKAAKKGSRWTKPGVESVSLQLKYYDGYAPDLQTRVRIRIKGDAKEFFSSDGAALSASARLKGSVLHKIMENVYDSSDLEEAVKAAVSEGYLVESESREAFALLKEALKTVSDRGWYCADKSRFLDERDIIDQNGEVYRPDRVVLRKDGGVDIVDYKFGQKRSSYLRQVARYIALYKAMGYSNIRGYLWYVGLGEIEEV